MERTSMSRKEFLRGSVLQRVADGSISLKEAAPLLAISYRQAKRIYARFRAGGEAGLVHANVGRRSNRAHSAEARLQALDLVRAHYSGPADRCSGQRFGPTLTAEHLLEDHGLVLPVSTLRDWMRDAGLWGRARRARPKSKRRERRAHFGDLVQLDGSFHDWFEGRGADQGRRSCVMNLVDDATGVTLLQFGTEETTWAAARVLRAWIAKYGVPRALYTDWKSVYKRDPTAQEQAMGLEGLTQFGRMCAKLGIKIIAAATPQAKGRVERSHGTQQDRLMKKMRLRGVSDAAAANGYVESVYLPQHNARFAISPASPIDYHVPRDPDVKDRDIFCLEHVRIVSNDYVVQFGKQALQLDRASRGRVPAGSQIIVRESEEGGLHLISKNRTGDERECAWTPAPARAPKPRGMGALPAVAPPAPRYKPAPDHPFRRRASAEAARATAGRA